MCNLINIHTYIHAYIQSTAVLFVELFFAFSPRLIEFNIHGTILSYVVFSKHTS